jgi:hypothetical protein
VTIGKCETVIEEETKREDPDEVFAELFERLLSLGDSHDAAGVGGMNCSARSPLHLL